MKITTSLVSDYHYTASNEEGNQMDFDMLPAGEKAYFSPTQALLGSLAACAAVDIVQMMKKKRVQVDDLVIETQGERREEVPRYFTEITQTFKLVSPDAEEKAFEKVVLLAVEKYCSVASSLSSEIRMIHKTEIHREPLR